MSERTKVVEILNDCLRVESWSLFQYLWYSRPWSENSDTVQTLDAIALDQQKVVQGAIQCLMQHDEVPDRGSYPTNWSCFNFIGLDFVLPKLIDESQQALTRYQSNLDHLGDCEHSQGVLNAAMELRQSVIRVLQPIHDELSARAEEEAGETTEEPAVADA